MNERTIEDRVRTDLQTLAGPPVTGDQARRAVERARTAGGRRRRGRAGPRGSRAAAWLAAAAVVMIVAAAAVSRLLVPSAAGPAAPTPITAWPSRGNLVHDADVIAAAQWMWRSGAPTGGQPGRVITTLYAGTVARGSADDGATVVILLSRRANQVLVAIVSSVQNLSGPDQPARHLILRSVASVDPGTETRSVGFVAAAAPADHPGSMAGSLGYVLLAPGITAGQVQSSMVDAMMTDTPGELPPAPNGLIGFVGSPGSGPWNSWVAVPKGTPGVDVLAAAVGAPDYTSGTVRNNGSVTTSDGTALHVGDLVVARDHRAAGDGLLGVVTNVDGRTGHIDASLNDLNRWNLQAVSYGSNYRGTLSRGTDGGLIFTTDPLQAPDGVSRVVVRTADGIVTVNVGTTSATSATDSNTTSPLPLRQTDTLPTSSTRPVWVIATGA